MKYLMFLLNCAAFILGIANVVYSCRIFKRRYLNALGSVNQKNATINFECNQFTAGLRTLGINILLAVIGIVASWCGGLLEKWKANQTIPLYVIIPVIVLICILSGVIYKGNILKLSKPYTISGFEEKDERFAKITMVLNGFSNFIGLTIATLAFHAIVIAYDFILFFM